MHETCETFGGLTASPAKPRPPTLACMTPFLGETPGFPHTRKRIPRMQGGWSLPGEPGNEHRQPAAVPEHFFVDRQEA